MIAAAGNLEHEQLLDALEREGWFEGDGREAAAAAGRAGARRARRPPAARSATRRRPTSSSAPTPFRCSDPRRFALAILTNVFGGGMSSRLFQRVREELGLAYAIFAYKHFYQSSGQLGVYIGTQPATADEAVDGDRRGVRPPGRARACPTAELADGKQQLKGQIMLSLESPAARMGRLAGFELHEDAYRPLDAMLAEIDAVTPDDMPRGGGGVLRAGAADGRAAGTGQRGSERTGTDTGVTLRVTSGHLQHHRGPMLIGVPKEIKTNENRIALVPAGAEALVAAGHTVLIEQGAGLGSGFPDDGLQRGGRHDPADGRRGLAARRDDHEGEGADRGRVAADAEGAGDLHLLPLRRGRGPHPGGHRVRRDRGGLRDGAAPERRAAAAHADVRGGGADGGAGGGQVPGEGLRRQRRPAGRRAGRGARARS